VASEGLISDELLVRLRRGDLVRWHGEREVDPVGDDEVGLLAGVLHLAYEVAGVTGGEEFLVEGEVEHDEPGSERRGGHLTPGRGVHLSRDRVLAFLERDAAGDHDSVGDGPIARTGGTDRRLDVPAEAGAGGAGVDG